MSLEIFGQLSKNELTLIVKFVEFSDKHGLTRVNADAIHSDTKDFGVRPILLRPTFEKLCQKNVLLLRTVSHFNDDDEQFYELNSEYADAIDEYMEFLTASDERPNVPAADRFVSTQDNQAEVLQAIESIEALAKAISSSNELFANSDERLQVSKEINTLKEIIEQPTIRISALWDATRNNSLLKWLAEQAVSAIVRGAATDAFQRVEILFHSLFSNK